MLNAHDTKAGSGDLIAWPDILKAPDTCPNCGGPPERRATVTVPRVVGWNSFFPDLGIDGILRLFHLGYEPALVVSLCQGCWSRSRRFLLFSYAGIGAGLVLLGVLFFVAAQPHEFMGDARFRFDAVGSVCAACWLLGAVFVALSRRSKGVRIVTLLPDVTGRSRCDHWAEEFERLNSRTCRSEISGSG